MNKAMVKYILQHAADHEWRLHGFGVLQLYLPDNVRIHLWDKRLVRAGVSVIHDHLQWTQFTSEVVGGYLDNIVYEQHPVDGILGGTYPLYFKGIVKTGTDGGLVGAPTLVALERRPSERLWAGKSYTMAGNVAHQTTASTGTVTIVSRERAGHELAQVFWPADKEYVTAAPRIATKEEVEQSATYALEMNFR